MDYKEKYEQALEVAQRFYNNSVAITKKGLEDIFPELKESIDERIKKVIKQVLSESTTEKDECYLDNGVTQQEVFAWLEKQGEQPKKHDVCDNCDQQGSCVSPCPMKLVEKHGEQKPNANCLLSWSETDEKMFQCLEGIVKDYWAKAEQEKNEIKIREASDVSYFLKTIQKSPLCWIKCSDGLPNRDGIYLVVTDGLHNEVYDMARYDSIDGWHKASEILYWMPIPQLNNKSIIEQKPVVPKFKVGDKVECIESFDGFIKGHIYTCKEDGWIGCDSQGDWTSKLDKFKAIPSNGGFWEGYNAAKRELEQKSAWGEEDERLCQCIIEDQEEALDKVSNDKYGHSEIISDLEEMYRERIAFLKSLKERYTWKPSDEQMDALEAAVSSLQSTALESLYNDLKKLREE